MEEAGNVATVADTHQVAPPDGQSSDTQSLQDIHKYLATFNKEISSEAGFVVDYGAGDAGSEVVGFEAGGGDRGGAPTLEAIGPAEDDHLDRPLMTPDAPTLLVEDYECGAGDAASQMAATYDNMQPAQQQQQQVVAQMEQQQQQMVQVEQQQLEQQQQQPATSENDAVIVNTGNAYQTVTIIPSEVAQGGEISYVLIVSHPDGEGKGAGDDAQGVDMSVYDFKEELKVAKQEAFDEEEDGIPLSEVRTLSQKSNTVANSMAMVQSQLMCNYCNYTSNKRYLLTRHMKTHSEERPHHCHICERGFKTIASLQNHINTHTGVRPHRCKECDAAFTTSGELVRHVRYRHTYEKPHRCPSCDYASVELSKLKRHIRSHTGERPYQCPHCAYASPDTYKLKRHLRIHTGEKPYECTICHARFTQSNSLKAHRLIHTGGKPVFQCELCPTTCGRKTDLKIHVQKLHTSSCPMQCRKCAKSFPDRYTYKIHAKTHDGEKCFRCELCAYAALSQRHLESHVLTHTGEKPFQCADCSHSFRQKQLLRRHRNLYHTPDYRAPAPRVKAHPCSVCGKRFAHRGNLLRHLPMHDPNSAEYQQAMEYEEEEEEEEEDLGSDDDMEGDGHNLQMVQHHSAALMQGGAQQQVHVLMGNDNDAGNQILLQVLPQLAANQDAMANVGGQQMQDTDQTVAAVAAIGDVDDKKGFPAMLSTVVIQPNEVNGSEEPDNDITAGVCHLGGPMVVVKHDVASAGEEDDHEGDPHNNAEDGLMTKRRRMEAAVALVQSQDVRMMDSEKQKNIDTCFGFNMD